MLEWCAPRCIVGLGHGRPAFSRSVIEDFSPLAILFVTAASDWRLARRGNSSAIRLNDCNIERTARAVRAFIYIVVSKPTHNYHASAEAASN
jgi:hypothetical protein